MRKFFACLLLTLLSAGSAAAQDPLVGYWIVHADAGDSDGGVIEFYANGDSFDGRIVRLQSPDYLPQEDAARAGQPRRDLLNPDPAKRNQLLVGLRVIQGMHRDSQGRYSGAAIYRPEDGRTYKGKAALSDDGQTLDIRGYLGLALLGETQRWTRTASPEAVTQQQFRQDSK